MNEISKNVCPYCSIAFEKLEEGQRVEMQPWLPFARVIMDLAEARRLLTGLGLNEGLGLLDALVSFVHFHG